LINHDKKCLGVFGGYLPINICRSFAKPPKAVQVVCECVVVVRGYKEVSWKSAKGMMADPNFLRSLQEMDVDAITQKQVQTVKGMLFCPCVAKPTKFL
jgi:hypothetical protein